MLPRMTEAVYRIFEDGPDYKVEIVRPGEITRTTLGFPSNEAAQAWVAQDLHIEAIDDDQRQSGPSPHLRAVE